MKASHNAKNSMEKSYSRLAQSEKHSAGYGEVTGSDPGLAKKIFSPFLSTIYLRPYTKTLVMRTKGHFTLL